MMINCRSSTKTTGFTLLEIVIAVGILAVISTISYASLIRYFDQSQRIEQVHLRLEQIQRLFALLEQDLRYIVARPVQYNNSTYAAFEVYLNRPVFTDEKMQLTTSRPTPLNQMTQTNFRVSWRLEDGAIYRYSWKELDLKTQTLADKMPELQHIQRVVEDISEFQILANSGSNEAEEDQEDYNEQAFTNDFDEQLYALPKLVKISVTTESGRNFYRILEIGSSVNEEI